jgi:molybdate transport system ATP-binding protein
MRARLGIALHEVSVRRGNRWALKDVSLRFKAGSRWALLGGNGAGKTQLLKLMATHVWPTPTGRERLVYRLGRHAIDLIEAKPLIAYVGAELQDKYARYGWNLEVREILATGLHRTDLLQQPVTRTERARVAHMLELCELEPLAKRRFLSLSYGQKRIVLLGRALIQHPHWLLLDEFYNGLDSDFRGRIDAILAHVRALGQAWVASAHRAVDVPRGTTGVIELRAGTVRSVGRLHSSDLDQLVARAEEMPRAVTAAAAQTAKRVNAVACARRAPVLLRLKDADLYVEYRAVLTNLNWELRAGEHWAIFGANGAGKSSFLKLLYGDLSPALGGSLERAGFTRGTPIAEWKRQVGFVSPELQTDYAVDVSVAELVMSGRHASIGLSDAPTAADKQAARRWLEFFSLLSVAERRPREQRTTQLPVRQFPRALAADPRMLLLDEPLTGLDPRQRAAMKRLLERLLKAKRTLIVAVHHPEDLPRGMTHALYLHNGRAEARIFHSAT